MNTMDVTVLLIFCQVSSEMKCISNKYLKQLLINKAQNKYNFDFTVCTIQELYRMCKLIEDPKFAPLIGQH